MPYDFSPKDLNIDSIMAPALRQAQQGGPIGNTMNALTSVGEAMVAAKKKKASDEAYRRLLAGDTGDLSGINIKDPQQAKFIDDIIRQQLQQSKDAEMDSQKAELEQNKFEAGKTRSASLDELDEAKAASEAEDRSRKHDLERDTLNETIRKNKAAEANPKGYIRGEKANELLGKDAYAADEMVSLAQLRLEQGAEKARQLSPKQSEMIANLDSGLAGIGEMRKILSSSGGMESKLKAGHRFSWFTTIGDTKAQKLAKYAGEVADVITRARTGAALNEDEQKFYGRMVLSALDTAETTEAMLSHYEQVFKTARSLMERGRGLKNRPRNEKEAKAIKDEYKASGDLEAILSGKKSFSFDGESPGAGVWIKDPEIEALASAVRKGDMTPQEAAIRSKEIKARKKL